MPAWLYETASAASGGVVGFGVLDALGMRLGTIEGWVWAPGGELAYLDVAQRSVLRENRHLVPLGYVVQVDPGHRYMHLRELTRRTLGTACPRFDDRRLPDEGVLMQGLLNAPDIRADVAARLRQPALGVDALVPERVAVRRDPRYTGVLDAVARPVDPAVPSGPAWKPLSASPALHAWRPLLTDEPHGDSAPF